MAMAMAMASSKLSVAPYQLLDFDWKLKYAVSSDSISAINKPLLRLELCCSWDPVTLENVSAIQKDAAQKKIRAAVAEYSKTELDSLILQLEAVSQALEGGVNTV
eukprot:c22110_g1_i1 orf=347-661(+)